MTRFDRDANLDAPRWHASRRRRDSWRRRVELPTRREAVILKAARSSDFDIEKLETASADAADIYRL